MSRLVFMGSPGFAVPALETLAMAGEYEIVGVYTQPDKPAGRGHSLNAPPAKQAALAHQLAVFQPRTLRTPQAQAELAALRPDLIVVAAYGLILPRAVLELPPHGCVNVHASLLPRYRGAAPVAAALLNGDSVTGISLMLVDEGVDTGPVLAQAELAIQPGDTTGTLTARLAQLGADLLAHTLPRWLAGQLEPRGQDEAQATLAPRLSKQDGCLDWSLPAVELERRVRAFEPWPGTFTFWAGRRLKVTRVQVSDLEPAIPHPQPGHLFRCGERVGVVTGQGTLELLEVQLEGKRVMNVAGFLCGHPECVGACLGE